MVSQMRLVSMLGLNLFSSLSIVFVNKVIRGINVSIFGRFCRFLVEFFDYGSNLSILGNFDN